jgi:peptidoglycan/LPS O-acetylase OafA/YrhL
METITRIKQRNDIQALRGLAVISVMFFHIDKSVFSNGYLGVDIFFVISGFVISNLIYSKISKNEFKFNEFIFMRFKRIVPALVSYLLFVQLVLFFNVDHQNVIQNTKTSIYSIFLLANVHIAQYMEYFTVDSTKNLVVNLWSLSVEEQFYIIFPFLAFLLSKVKISFQYIVYFILLVFSMFSINHIFYENLSFLQKIFLNYQNYIFYSPITRVWEFILGVLSMFMNQKIKKKNYFLEKNYIGYFLYAILGICLLSNMSIFSNLTTLLLANITTFFLLAFDFKSLIGNKFMIFTGNISYSLYLFHQGVFAGIRNHNHYSTIEGNYFNLDNKIVLIIILIFIYLISTINYYVIEEKFRKVNFPSISEFKSLIFLMVVTFFMMALSLNTNGYAFRHTDLNSFNKEASTLEYINGTNYLKQDGKQCLNRSKSEELCKFETSKENKKIYVVGDSMVSSLVNGFLNNGINDNYTIIEATKGGCPLLLDMCDFYEGSDKFNALVNVKDSIFIIGGRYQSHLNESMDIGDIEENLIKTIELLNDNRNKVYLITPIPEPGINERMYYFKNSKYLHYEYKKWKNDISGLSRMFNRINLDNFSLLEIDYLFCDQQICNFKSDEYYYFLDHVHFSYYGSNFVAHELIRIIEHLEGY